MTVVTDPLVYPDGTEMDPGPRLDVPEMPPGLSRDRRRTILRLQLIELGVHPVTHLPLRSDAPEDASAKDRYVRDLTCGSCEHRAVIEHHNRNYMKCDMTTMTRSATSDTRRWYPACSAYRPVDTGSRDDIE